MAVAQITAVIEVQFLVWELPHASGTAIKKKKKKRKEINVLSFHGSTYYVSIH